ncbi:MAG: DUF1232 domain-containing protein [Ignavibacteria bacterium]|nr:DUF1232 domain-containing protein [Ignavibacteria bacterium]
MDNNQKEKIIEKIEEASESVDEKDVKKVIKKSGKIMDKAKKLDLKILSKLFYQVRLAIEMLKDYRTKSYGEIPWRTISLITVALLYFWNPFDVIPDLIPVFGFTDDAIAFASIFKAVQTDLQKYAEWKGYETDKYF